jgi:hypothetical protein
MGIDYIPMIYIIVYVLKIIRRSINIVHDFNHGECNVKNFEIQFLKNIQ